MRYIFLLLAIIMIGTAEAAITGQTLITNLSANNDTDRVIMGSNSSINITFTESASSNYTNLTFPTGFSIDGVLAGDVTTNVASVAVAGKASRILNLTYTGRAGGVMYFNITANATASATSGDHSISIQTNATRTASTVSIYTRNASRPYYLTDNNSVFTVTNETFGQDTTTITLSGKGSANLTFRAPNLSSQPNILVGWGATNATKVRSNRSDGQTTIFVMPNPSVQDPVIVLSAQNEHESDNIPAGIVAGGAALIGYIVYYKIRRRKR